MAQQYGYQPNAIARTLNNRQSRLVAVVVNAIGNQCEAEQLDLLVHRLQARALVPIILCCGDNYRPFAVDAPRVDLPGRPCGHRLRFSAAEGCGADIQDHLADYRLGGTDRRREGFMCACRWRRGSFEIIDKLVGDGRGHFAYLYGRTSSWIDKQRREWFSGALARHGLAFEAEGHGDYSYDSGFKEASLILHRSKVDALVCGNDVMAIGARDAAIRLLNRHVPERFGYRRSRRYRDGALGVSRPDHACARSSSSHRCNYATHGEARNRQRRSSHDCYQMHGSVGFNHPVNLKGDTSCFAGYKDDDFENRATVTNILAERMNANLFNSSGIRAAG